jgi:LSD1 subclass zinc finger protein
LGDFSVEFLRRKSQAAAWPRAVAVSSSHIRCRMAGHMAWFQVTCPQCRAALQTKLPAGVTSVQCSQCKIVFGVDVPDAALPHRGQEQRSQRRQQHNAQPSNGRTPTMRLYNDFMREEMARLRREQPELVGKEHHTTVFKMAASNWADAPSNPKNASAEDGATADGSGSGSPAAEDGVDPNVAETGSEAAGQEAGVEGAEEFDTFDQGIAGGDDSPVETAERDAGTDVQMAAAVLRAVQLQRQRVCGRVRRDTGMSAGGLCAGETSADGERPDPPSAEKAASNRTRSVRRRAGSLEDAFA